jgi:peptidoglycan/LPS O-acetylase OafA/YrhL
LIVPVIPVALTGRGVASGGSPSVVQRMNRPLAFEFLVYGIALAGLGLLIHQQAPDLGLVALVTGIAGGALSVLWGVLALCGYRRRWWIVLTLGAVSFVLLSQAVTAWMRPAGAENHSPTRLAAVWITVLLVLSLGMLMNLLHGQGRTYDRDAEGAQKQAGIQPSSSASATKPAAAPPSGSSGAASRRR